jgi:hypothetical protein
MTFGKLKKYIGKRINDAVSIPVYSNRGAVDEKDTNYIILKYPTYQGDNTLIKTQNVIEIDYFSVSEYDINNSDTVLIAAAAVKATLHGGYGSESEGFYKSYCDYDGEIPDNEFGVYHYYQRFFIEHY